jgi:hypothetical protein
MMKNALNLLAINLPQLHHAMRVKSVHCGLLENGSHAINYAAKENKRDKLSAIKKRKMEKLQF